MSKVLEKSIGGFISSVFGPSTTLYNSPFDPGNAFEVSIGLKNYVERLEAARKISKQEEEDIIREEYQEWLRQASHQNTKNEVIANYLCRSLIAFSRGHYFTNLHINAIKLTQSEKLLQKKLGYLYISRTMAPGSDLTVLLVNTVQRDLSSYNIMEISMGLNLIPVILSAEVASIISSCIVPCLNHHQICVKRRAASIAYKLCFYNEDQNAFNILIPYLAQLLSNSEPSVAIAAINTLSKAYKTGNVVNINSFFDEIAKCAAHIIIQAATGNLSNHYDVGTIRAPFVQVQMLRAIRNINIGNWNPPDEVYSAIVCVFEQPLGGRNLSLYMTLLEAVETVACLPRKDDLVSHSLKIVLKFLKSSSIDFKYLGIKALGSIFTTIEDLLTEAHLKAVLECLDTSNILLRSKTIKLMCSMANKSNYQPICATLMEFAHKTNNFSTQDLVMNHISDILRNIDADIPWCISFLTPLVSSSNPKQSILKAMETTIFKGMKTYKPEEEMDVIIGSCKKLFEALLNENVCQPKLRTVAYILNVLFEFKSDSVNIDFVSVFIDKLLKTIDNFESECDITLQCLFNCGFILPSCLERVKSILNILLHKKDININIKVREKLLLLNNISLTKKIYEKKATIENGHHKIDLSLSFCDDWVIKALEKGAPAYKPFTVKSRNIVRTADRKLLNPFNASQPQSLDKDDSSVSDSTRSSQYGSGSITGSITKDRSIWTAKGRIKPLTNDTDNEVMSGCVEIAHEAQESLLLEDDVEQKPSAASSYLESQKLHLTQALIKGFGFSK